MRLDDYRTSDNVGEQAPGSGGGGGGLGGGALGLILSLVGSKFGFTGIIVVIVGAMLLGFNPFGGGMSGGGGGRVDKAATEVCAADPTRRFTCQVLASTEDTWAKLFQQAGQQYRPAGLDFYTRSGSSGCGSAQSAMGPFYCPNDNKVYLDTTFYDQLQNQFGAAGDFAQAYVIAHEVGHHIQFLEGTLDQARQAQQSVGGSRANAIQVQIELQADCYAGVWAAHNKDRLEPGDVEEGMRAAEAIGDDTLQSKMQGRVVPESFTHGSSAQRMAALRRGMETGNPRSCAISG